MIDRPLHELEYDEERFRTWGRILLLVAVGVIALKMIGAVRTT
jgi:hypothetical protein